MKAGSVTYSDELAIKICAEIALGKSLNKICKQEGMPHVITVYQWLADDKHQNFLKMYERAKEDQADTLADEIRDAAEALEDMANGKDEKVSSARVQAYKVKLDALIWTASHLKPKKYGQKIQQEVTTTSYTDVLTRIARGEGKEAKPAPKPSTTRATKVGDDPITTH